MLIKRDIAVHSHTLYLSLCAGDIRLVGGSIPSEGRVELFYEREWKGAFVYRYTAAAVRVACRQVGYPYSDGRGTGEFRSGSIQVWIAIWSCNGDEERVEQCEHFGFRNNYISTDIGVRCRGEWLQGMRYIHKNTISMYMCFEESQSACHTISSAISQVQRMAPIMCPLKLPHSQLSLSGWNHLTTSHWSQATISLWRIWSPRQPGLCMLMVTLIRPM